MKITFSGAIMCVPLFARRIEKKTALTLLSELFANIKGLLGEAD